MRSAPPRSLASRAGCLRARPARVRLRPPGGGRVRPARTDLGWTRSGRRADRGVRGAVAGLCRRLDGGPGDPQHRVGAIAIGHPLGASGGRVIGTLVNVLRERNKRRLAVRWPTARRSTR
ncbi:hypothetical protein ACFQV2_12895 [Actinokineospora soli]|uniref:Thiolase C-terminal domain-containing protein n=1 Tax=Actinokineospora soli TaxID=1048753 RepID=A0ABW2TNA2_9PSEU